jgi:cytochrome c553
MLRFIIFISIFFYPTLSISLDIENAKRINQSCALCHGIYGQGTPGTLSPRLAGLSADYLAKELKFYRSGKRNYLPMIIASSIKTMSDKDINDISNYLAGINLRNLNLPKIPEYSKGDHKLGKKEFMRECKTCHKKDGLGDMEDGVPPLAGQYGSYIFSQFKKFQNKERYHDDDPEDELFIDYKDSELDNIISFVTKLPPHGFIEKVPEPFKLEMSGMTGMTGNKIKKDINENKSINWSSGALKISGIFRVTPTGEIVLNPTNQDLRDVAGTSGKFEVVDSGIIFTPE